MKTAEECLDFYGVRVYGSMRERIISAMELHEQSRVSELEREKVQIIDSYNALSSENSILEKEVETLRETMNKLMASYGKGEPDQKCDC